MRSRYDCAKSNHRKHSAVFRRWVMYNVDRLDKINKRSILNEAAARLGSTLKQAEDELVRDMLASRPGFTLKQARDELVRDMLASCK